MHDPGTLSFVLEGRLVGPWVDELRRITNDAGAAHDAARLTIDLCGLTGMDTEGQKLLEELLQRGATLHCSDVMNQYLIEQMARPTGRGEETCRPCRKIPSQRNLSIAAEEALASLKAS